MSTPKISVIVPVYKVEKYLHRCIDSILAQTFPDFELLLINDGSPDNSASICDEYAAKDMRIRVFHKENGGVSSARNLGLDNAKGEWVAFVDSDDWIENQYLEQIQSVPNLNDLDMIHFGIIQEWNNFYKVKTHRKTEFISKESFFNLKSKSSCSFAYFYRRGLIESYKIRFNSSIKYSEDREFIAIFAMVSHSFYMLNSAQYHYVYNPHSAVNSQRAFKNYFDDLVVIESLRIFQSQLEKEGKHINLPNYYILLLNSFIDVSSTRKWKKKEKEQLIKRFKLVSKSIGYINLSTKYIIKFQLFKVSPILLYYLKQIKKLFTKS